MRMQKAGSIHSRQNNLITMGLSFGEVDQCPYKKCYRLFSGAHRTGPIDLINKMGMAYRDPQVEIFPRCFI